MRGIKTIITFLALCLFFRSMNAQNLNTQGRDFWFSFIAQSPEAHNPVMEVNIAGEKACQGKLVNPHTGWSTTFTVTPGAVTTVAIPNAMSLMELPNQIEKKAIHLTSSQDVSVYVSNYFKESYDVANVLPTAMLQDKYIALSYESKAEWSPSVASRVLIVATENKTEVVIEPKSELYGVFPPMKKQTIRLNAGECYMYVSAAGDISGTYIRAKDGKKIAVFSGNDAQVPKNKCCIDFVFEQCMPLSCWGRHFVVTSTSMRKCDYVRITSASKNCKIYVNGDKKKTLGARETFDYKLDGKDEAVFISASKPVFVCLYVASFQVDDILGDPAMVNINPIEQQMDKVTFCSYNTTVIKHHFVNIVTRTSQVDGMTLDEKSIASEFKQVSSKNELSYARVSIDHGSHTLVSSEGGFVAHIYGLGRYESYAYSVGSNSMELNQFDDDGNLIVSNIPNDLDDEELEEKPIEEEPAPICVITDTLPMVHFGGIDLSKTEHAKGVIDDKEDLIIDPDDYDVEVDSNYDYLFDSIVPSFVDDTIMLDFHMRQSWCDCFLPNEIHAEVVMTPKESDDKEQTHRIIIPITVPIVKESSWLSRCLWVLVTIVGLLVLVGYLLALLKKNRFKKYATINPSYFTQTGGRSKEVVQAGTPLRKSGLWAWLNRWFNPFMDEQFTNSWSVPRTGVMTFVASHSKEEVLLTKSSFKADTMSMPGYNPRLADSKQRLIPMSGKIAIYADKNKTKRTGSLSYDSGSGNDEGGFRLLVGIIIAASVLTMLVLVVLMVRGLI